MAGTALKRRGLDTVRGVSWGALLTGLAAALLLCLPAKASAATYCVDITLPECEQPTYSGDQGLQDGLTAAQGNPGPDTVRVGAMTYQHPSDSAYSYNDGGTPENTVSIVGSGEGIGGTEIAGPATLISDTSFFLDGASTISNLRFTLPVSPELSPGNVAADTGLSLSNGATARGVTLVSSNGVNLTAVRLFGSATFEQGTVSLPTGTSSVNTGIYSSQDQAAVRDSSVTSTVGIVQDALSLAEALTISRTRVGPGFLGIQVVGGSLDVDDTLVEVGSESGAIGVHLYDNNNNSPIPRAADLRHMTIVGPSGSTGIRALARATTAGSDSTVTLDDSVIDGPGTPVALHADNGRTASLTSNYSNFDQSSVEENDDFNGDGTDGAVATFTATNHTELAPGFVGGGDYHLAASSPLIDIGNPAPGGPPSDIDGQGRVQAGSCGGGARRDIGADEFMPSCAVPEPEPEPTPKADRTLILDVNKGKVEKGRKVRLSGQLEAAGNDAACEAAQTIEVLRDGLKRGTPQTVATLTTDTQGNYAAKLKVRKTSLYTSRTPETDACESETSDTEKVRVQKPKAAKEA